MKYSLVKVETLSPWAKFICLERLGYGKPEEIVAYTIVEREYDDTFYEMMTYATRDADKTCYRYVFADGTLVLVEDP